MKKFNYWKNKLSIWTKRQWNRWAGRNCMDMESLMNLIGKSTILKVINTYWIVLIYKTVLSKIRRLYTKLIDLCIKRDLCFKPAAKMTENTLRSVSPIIEKELNVKNQQRLKLFYQQLWNHIRCLKKQRKC